MAILPRHGYKFLVKSQFTYIIGSQTSSKDGGEKQMVVFTLGRTSRRAVHLAGLKASGLGELALL